MPKYYLWISFCLAVAMSVTPRASVAQNAARWHWLADTYWYVPHDNLLAVASTPGARPLPVSDQTVYHILEYDRGYFWGPTAVSYQRLHRGTASGGPSCLQLVGSVTPEGRVHLSFTALPANPSGAAGSSTEPTVGIGAMTWQRGEWTMENQMSTVAVGNVLLTHWAYMRQCRLGQACFSALPGVGVPLPEFLAPCRRAAGGPG